MKKIAINGFGRIGRMALRAIKTRQLDIEVVAVNDLADSATMAHLLEFDSTYGSFNEKITYTDDTITVDGHEMKNFTERDPSALPWSELGVDVVLECTGIFRTREKATLHQKAGAKRVIISAPAKDKIDATFVMGVNDSDFDPERHFIISNASCTTNCLAPFTKVLHEKFKIEKGLMTTIHSYTGDQRLLDAPHRDLRRARAAALSMIPTTTGAAKAVALVLPELDGKLNGFAIRVPTPTVSMVDLTVELGSATSKSQINETLKKASESELAGILGYEDRSLVSVDYRMDSRSSIIDAQSTVVIGNNMAKIIAWYDNEWGYANRLVDLASFVAR